MFRQQQLSACLLGLLAATSLAGNAHAICAAPEARDLNHRYDANDRGKYFVSQYGNEVWWLGLSEDGGKTWANVFKGTRSGDTITGQWADVTYGAGHNHGELELHVNRNTEFTRIKATGGIATSRWGIFAPCDDVSLNPR